MVEFDMISGIGFLIFQPILGSIIIALTIGICFLMGISLRRNKKHSAWWRNNQLIPIMGLLVGLLLFALSFLPSVADVQLIELEEGLTVEKHFPNSILAFSGWFLSAFSLLHFYPLSFWDSLRSKTHPQN
jgi:hypothetical protein